MIKKTFISLAVCLQIYESYSQLPEQKLAQWVAQSPIEKIYLHFDREEYIAGQTIWFKAYLVSDFLPASKSTDLFVEVINASSAVIDRQAFPVVAGYSRGQVALPDTLSGGSYMLRAYTATQLNQDADFLYK